ncbi:MAG: hypothetical protein ABIT37_18800 [Luteolibacter sp.]
MCRITAPHRTPPPFTKQCKVPVTPSSRADKSNPITPFGGPVSLIAFFERIGLAGRIGELMPFTYTIALLAPEKPAA